MPERPRPFRHRLALWYAGTLVAVLAIFGAALERSLESRLLEQLTDTLVGQAEAVRLALPESEASLPAATDELGDSLGVRVTVIAADGTVLADSASDPASMENHADRPEVVAALAGEVGVASRTSATVGVAFRYVALPISEGRIVRVALAETELETQVAALRAMLVVGALTAAAAGLVGVGLVSRAVTRPLDDFTAAVEEVRRGEGPGIGIAGSGIAELDRLGEAVSALALEVELRVDEISRERELRDVVLSALGVGVVLVDGEEVVYANPAAQEVLGARVSVVSQLHPVLLRDLVRTAWEGDEGSGELELGVPTRTIAASAVRLTATGQVMLTLTDVTEARRAEAIRRDFVSAASHELKTPAAAIQAGAETVIRALDNDPEAALYFAQRIGADALRLSRIVGDLLDLSRLETRDPQRAPVALDQVIHDEVARLGTVPVGVMVETTPVVVEGDASDLGLAVRNLLDNAVRYTPEGGHVWVRLNASGGEATVEVTDDGSGIPAADLPRIFERFYRVDAARSRHTGGTGLGLAIVKHVAEQHGGRVEAASVLGEGSTFRVVLPAVQ